VSREEVRMQWKSRIEEFRESGQTAAEWCRVHSLNVTQFRRWIHRFPAQYASENNPSTIRWLSAQTVDAAIDVPTITVNIGEVHIEVRDGFSPTLLRQVVQALAE
jgi:hypothetical protein